MPDSGHVGEQVRVPVFGGPPHEGVILGEAVDPRVGRVFIVRFRSGATVRLTPQEVELRHAG